MTYDVLTIARYIVNYSNKIKHRISNLKLQKLLYFVQAYFLVNKNTNCFHEDIEAWSFGPVVPEAYREFKEFGSGYIPQVETYYEYQGITVESKTFDENVIDEIDRKTLNYIVDQFKDYSAAGLVDLTHAQKPWRDAYVPMQNNIITPESMKRYFSGE